MTIYIYKASRRRRRVHTYRTSLREVLLKAHGIPEGPMFKSRFEWLGYTYVIVPKGGFYSSYLIGKGQRFTRGKDRVNQSVLLNYITYENSRSIKLKIKQKIRSVK